jgi:hypothetical protein
LPFGCQESGWKTTAIISIDRNTKKQLAACYQNFNPDEHIWTKTKLLNKIAALFDNDPDRFQSATDLLEEEFGEKKSKNPLPGALYQCSKTRHEDLTRRGRFRGLHIRDILLLPWQLEKLAAPEKRWLDAGVRLKETRGTVSIRVEVL